MVLLIFEIITIISFLSHCFICFNTLFNVHQEEESNIQSGEGQPMECYGDDGDVKYESKEQTVEEVSLGMEHVE